MCSVLAVSYVLATRRPVHCAAVRLFTGPHAHCHSSLCLSVCLFFETRYSATFACAWLAQPRVTCHVSRVQCRTRTCLQSDGRDFNRSSMHISQSAEFQRPRSLFTTHYTVIDVCNFVYNHLLWSFVFSDVIALLTNWNTAVSCYFVQVDMWQWQCSYDTVRL